MTSPTTDRDRLARITGAGPDPEAVRTALTTMMRKGLVPGLSMAVVDRDGVLLAEGHGTGDLPTGTPAAASTAYLWFSMTKLVTATAAVRLADEGRLDLDAPVGEYVTYLEAPGADQPTVRQLLDHTAGLANPVPIRWAHPAEGEGPDPEELLRRLLRSRRAYRYRIGDLARYSNVGYLALGEIISATAGTSYETYVQQAMLEPLGMSRTGFRHPTDTDVATGYVKAPRIVDPLLRRVLPVGIAGHRHGRYLGLNPFEVDGPAYGGLIGDVLDAARFLRMHLRDGELDGQRILAPRSARRMRTIDRIGKPFHHGLGWFRRPNGHEDHVEHFGAGVGFWNVMRLYPSRGIGVVVMSNTTTAYDFEPLFALVAATRWR